MLAELELCGELTIEQAPLLRDKLVERLSSDAEPLCIDLSRVTSVDTAIVQLFIACKVRSSKTSFIGSSDELKERFERMGVIKLLI